MRSLNPGMYLAAVNAAYSMVKYGGYSAKIETLEEPVKGYMVTVKTLKIYPNISSVNAHEVSSILREETKNLDLDNIYIGSFQDPDTKEVMFEISVNIEDYEEALIAGDTNKQKYIWDVENKENIKL